MCAMIFTRAIVRPPAPNFGEGLTTNRYLSPDYHRALVQHDEYCEALEKCGLALTRLEPDPNFPDSTFVEDVAVLTSRGAILTRPGAPSRAGEVASIKEALAHFYSQMLTIDPPGTLDGGDICQAGDHFLIGISDRTNESGAHQLSEILAALDFTSALVDIRGTSSLHLKSSIAYLGDNRLVLANALADRQEFAGYECVLLESYERTAANCVLVNGHLLVPSGHGQWEEKLRNLGYTTIALHMTEFQKMDGGLSCLSLRF
jgi:dimethylargininase